MQYIFGFFETFLGYRYG
jgi:hypothetical protein